LKVISARVLFPQEHPDHRLMRAGMVSMDPK
jgi:hypothetical protein